MEKKKKLYCIMTSHLDTQWNWTIQDTIRDCIKNTLERNFYLLDKYPHYHMNFEGAFRYKLAKEYYPDLYEKLKRYIADGRWSVAGGSWDAMDANVPSSEALMRQILYGNGYFEKEFGVRSKDIFLTDCFGFRYSLPSIGAHMGLMGFSTQKLFWGVRTPIVNEDGTTSKPSADNPELPRLDLGKWYGPDGKYLISSLLENDYTYSFDNEGDTSPINQRELFLSEIEHNAKYSNVPYRSMYYGCGDYGGSCKESSARMLNEAIENPEGGWYDVISATTTQLFEDLTEEEISSLPSYDGELLIPHGSGVLTSHTINKRWNRKNELLADSAERAAVIASWLGTSNYPAERLLTAWQTFLWHQFHDDLPGTSISSAYVFSYNDYVIALNMFASELENAVGSIARSLDTNVCGTPVVVFNPVSYNRCDLVCADIKIDTPYVRVFDGQGNEVPAQISVVNGKSVVKFAANVAPVSCTVFDVRASEEKSPLTSEISVADRVLENQRYIVTINENGDIASIIDKANENTEILSAPIRLEIGPDSSKIWPSWELVWSDGIAEPIIVGGEPEFEIVDNGPAVVSVRVRRKYENSTFDQVISLVNGGQRVDVANEVQWYQRASNLRAAFPLSVSNPKVTLDLGLGAVESGNTDSYPYYQHVVHQWADLTAEDGSYGVSIMNDCKYGLDKPNDNTVRITLIHTPPEPFAFRSGQDWQDMGRNIFSYSIMGHNGFRNETTAEAAKFNQPLTSFSSAKHDGIGRDISFVSVNDEHVIIRCIKKEEKGKRIIVRVQETSGKGSVGCSLKFLSGITSAVEMNGFEDEIGPASICGDTLTFDLTRYEVKTYAVELTQSYSASDKIKSEAIALPFNRAATSANDDKTTGEFAHGISIPAEIYEEKITVGGIPFEFAPAGGKNAVVCAGQKITLPAGYDKLYILASSTDGDKYATFKVGERDVTIGIQDFAENVGSWDMMVAGTGCLIKRDEIAVNFTHTHDADGDRLYQFAYLFKYEIDIKGADSITLPDDSSIIIMAATAAESTESHTLAPLYDVADRDDTPVHKLTILNADGSVRDERLCPEGKIVAARTLQYDGNLSFDHWTGEDIISTFGPNAFVKMPDHDTVVQIHSDCLGEDILAFKPCVGSRESNPRDIAKTAVDPRDDTKWCAYSFDGTNWLEVDACDVYTVSRWHVMHAGIHENKSENTRAYRLEYKVNENDDWRVADRVDDNTADETIRDFKPVEGRYFRLFIEIPSQSPDDKTTRITMFRVFKV